MRHGSDRISVVTFALMLSLMAGCGDQGSSVSGQITVDGQPVAAVEGVFGQVLFYREEGGGAPATGTIDESGRYQLNTGANAGLVPGAYLVGVTLRQALPRKQDELPQSKLLVPAKYANPKESGLRAEVQTGSNEFDFALSSNPSA